MTAADVLRAALPGLRRLAEPDMHYGTPLSADPRDFTPDPECSTEEERAYHRSLCEAWGRGERPPIPPTHQTLRNDEGTAIGWTTHQPLGLGTTTIRNPEAEGLYQQALTVLGITDAEVLAMEGA